MNELKKVYRHWRLEVGEHNIGWLYLDKEAAAVNILASEVLLELQQLLEELATKRFLGLIITSAKSSGFIAGANIEEIKAIKTAEEATRAARIGQQLFDQLENLPYPTVAHISGFCVGGGLELALTCTYRVALDSPKTRLGLPEVKLGILPGWGGLLRLPRLIGAPQALNLMLNGHTVSARAAEKLGLVDAAVPKRHFKTAAEQFLLKPPRRQTSVLKRLSNHAWVRPIIAKMVRKQVARRVKESHYPAPYAILDTWKEVGLDEPRASEVAAEVFGGLRATKTSEQLVRVFFLQERLKSFGKDTNFQPKRVHVIGAGVMGGDIAAYCALQGMQVTLQDREAKLIAPAIKRAHGLYKDKLKAPRAVQEVMDRLTPDVKGEGIARADLIIEAIHENLEAKQKLFKTVEATAKRDALLATNTSSLLLEEIGSVLKEPSRLVGIHFFNPVAKMPLVEIVHHSSTYQDSIQKACSFVRGIGKLPLPVKSSPCFLINRILAPYLLEAALLYSEGVPPAAIDKAAEDFGMPMGPILLLDTIGLDVGLAVAEKFSRHYGGIPVPEQLRKIVAEGHLGKKTGKGFYQYEKGKPVKAWNKSGDLIADDVQERLISKMLNESKACLQDGIVADADLLDAGMIFGAGFAPFRGGPMQYMQSQIPTEGQRGYERNQHNPSVTPKFSTHTKGGRDSAECQSQG